LKLDVGCGAYPRGDVNTDLNVGKINHFQDGKIEINPKSIRNFVKCDIHNLPFRDKTFSEAFCSNVLEHKGVNFVKAVKEMSRVASKLTINVPHRFSEHSKLDYHDKFFDVKNISTVLHRMGFLAVSKPTMSRYFPSRFFPLFRLPKEIQLECWRK